MTMTRLRQYSAVMGRVVDYAPSVSATFAAHLAWAQLRRPHSGAYRHLGVETLSALRPDDVRSTDTAILFGSGPSAEPAAEAVRGQPRFDVFAVNHAAALALPARVYSVETPVLHGRQASLSLDSAMGLLEWALARSDAVNGVTPVIIRGEPSAPATAELVRRVRTLGCRIYLASKYTVPTRGKRGATVFVRWAMGRGVFSWPTGDKRFISLRGGMGFLVSLAVALGYPKIVLAGVDLNSERYFFDDWSDRTPIERRPVLAAPTDRVHRAAVTLRRHSALPDLLVALDKELRAVDRQMVVASANSALYPDLGLWNPPAKRSGDRASK